MADLIERDALVSNVSGHEISMSVCLSKDERDGMERMFNTIMNDIQIAPAVNRWIPCSERLPKDFVWCLVCMSDGCIRLGKWNGEYDEQGVWWVSHPNSGGKLYRIKNVPFWMPLPEQPEKE